MKRQQEMTFEVVEVLDVVPAKVDDQIRDEDGKYSVGWDRLCTCGHSKGVHAAGRKGRSAAECIAADFPDGPPKVCPCRKFKAARR